MHSAEGIPGKYEQEKENEKDYQRPNRKMEPGVLRVVNESDCLAHDDETCLLTYL